MSQQNPQQLEAGRRAELAGLWSRSQQVVEAFIWSMVPDSEDREDLLQDVATQAALSFDDYDRERPFANWAVGIARYRILEYRRKRARDMRVLSSEVLDHVAQGIIEAQANSSARALAMEACVGKLSPRHRTLIEMRYAEDLEVGMIAKRMGSRPNTISVALHKVRVMLGECIELRMRIMKEGK